MTVCSEFRTWVFVLSYSVFLIYLPYDSASDQTAEVLQTYFCYVSGASEDPEEIPGKERSGVHAEDAGGDIRCLSEIRRISHRKLRSASDPAAHSVVPVQVIQNIPAYVGSVKNVFDGLATQIIGVNGYTDLIQNFITDNKMSRVRLFLENEKATTDSVIDFLYALSPSQWEKLADMNQFSGFSDLIDSTASKIADMQDFWRSEHRGAAVELY